MGSLSLNLHTVQGQCAGSVVLLYLVQKGTFVQVQGAVLRKGLPDT